MDDCIFCKIVSGALPCSKVGETAHFLAFLDINPVSEGHTLIVPKQHSKDLLDLPAGAGEELVGLLQLLGTAIMRATGAAGFNVGLNNGSAAGQVVFHTHFHIIPRTEGDGLSSWPQQQASVEELRAIAARIIKNS